MHACVLCLFSLGAFFSSCFQGLLHLKRNIKIWYHWGLASLSLLSPQKWVLSFLQKRFAGKNCALFISGPQRYHEHPTCTCSYPTLTLGSGQMLSRPWYLYNCGFCLFHIFHGPGALWVLSHVILMTILWGRHDSFHFIVEGTEVLI